MSGMLFLPKEQNDQELRAVIQRVDYEYTERQYEAERKHIGVRYELDEQYQRDMEQAYSEFWEVAHD